MSNRLKSFALASLVFSLTCGVGLAASDVVVKHTLAQTATSSDGKREADKLFLDGVQQFRRGEYPKALQTYQRVLEIRRKLGDKVGEAATLNRLGEVYNGLNQPTQALEVLQQAVNLYKVITDKAANGEVINNIGTSYRLKNDNTKALQFYQQALEIRQQLKDKQGEGKTLSNIGLTFNNQQQYPKALETLQQALLIHKEVKDRYWEGYTLIRIGIVYGDSRDYKNELQYYQQALILNRELGNKDGEFRTLSNMGWHYNSQKHYGKAIDFWQQSLVVVREVQNKSLEALSLIQIGDTYSNQSQFDKAISFYKQALSITQKLKNQPQEGSLFVKVANTYLKLNQYEKAIDNYQQGLSIVREIPNNKLQTAAILYLLGDTYFEIKQYQHSLSFYQQALPIAKEIINKALEAQILDRIGDSYLNLQQYDQAIAFYQQALPVAQEAKNQALTANILIGIGSGYNFQDNKEKYIEYVQQALKIQREIKDKPAILKSLLLVSSYYGSKAVNFYTRGLIAQAKAELPRRIEFAEEALNLAKELKQEASEATALYALGQSYFILGDNQKALELSQQAVKIARDIKDRDIENSALNNLAQIYMSQGNTIKKIEVGERQVAIKREQNDSLGLAYALVTLASDYVIAGKYQQALETNQEALVVTQKIEISQLPSYQQENAQEVKLFVSDIYAQLAGLLNSQGAYKEAFQIRLLIEKQEIREARGSRDVAESKLNIPLTPTEAKIPEQAKITLALATQISECEKANCRQLTELKNQLSYSIQEFSKELKKIDKEIGDNRGKDEQSFNPKALKEAQAIVEVQAKATQANTVMIYPLVLENELWLQVYGQKGLVKTEKVAVSRKELRNTVRKFRELMGKCEPEGSYCSARDIAEIQQISQQIYRWLIKPLEKELTDNQVKNLIFALHREIRYIPMSTLHDGKQYLIEKYTIHNVTTENFDKQDKLNANIQNTPLLGMGLSKSAPDPNPNSNKSFRALLNVPKELEAIIRENTSEKQGIFPGRRYLNEVFNFETLRDNLNKYKILHLATHGVFDSTSPEKSYILMGDGNPLTPTMISSLIELNDIHLVVLSACQTALATSSNQNEPQDGVEINTLAYEFMNRGAKSVMASLWKVDDPSTAKLMQLFYKNLAAGKMTKSEALRQAQLSMLKGDNYTVENGDKRGAYVDREEEELPRNEQRKSSYSHPYYWAPFILIGNGL
jgi:CHAT domain-containing protein/uncharacterized protein HemY